MDKAICGNNTALAMLKSVEYKVTKNLCSNCSQILSVRDPLRPRGLRSPLILHCGHSACEHCIRTSVQNTKRVICGVCNHTSAVKCQNPDVREDFPLNMYLLGVFASRYWGQEPEDSKIAFVPVASSGSVNRTSLSSKGKYQNKEICSECAERDAEWKCLQCEVPYCSPCYTKVHKAARALAKHKKTPLENSPEQMSFSIPMCEVHVEQKLEFFCVECQKMLCPHCIICFHQGHDIVTKRQKNEEMIAVLDESMEKATEVMKRLLHSQKKLCDVLMIQAPGCNMAPIEQEVAQHFTYLHGVLQLLEHDILKRLKTLKTEKTNSLQSIMSDINLNVHHVKELLQEGTAAKEPANLDKIDLGELINKLTKIQSIPCHLISTERNSTEPLVKFVVDETFVQQVESHCDLEVQDTTTYNLVTTEDLPPDAVIEPIEEDTEYDTLRSLSSRASSVSTLSEAACLEKCSTLQNENGSSNVAVKNKRNVLEMVQGSSETVIVSHVRDPSSFYIQRVMDIRTLEQLSTQLNKYAPTLGTSPPDSIISNGLYIVEYHDHKWYRVRVRAIHPALPDSNVEEMAEVLYIDYGNSEVVATSKLRCIPPRFANTPAMSYHCSLFGLVPCDGKWTQESVKTLAMMVNGVQVKMVIMDYRADIFEVDLCQIAGDILDNDVPLSVRDALVFLEHACFLKAETPKVMIMDRPGTTYFRENDLEKGNVIEVLISHIESPHSFYVQRLGDHAKYLSCIMKDMNEAYTNAGNRGLIFYPQVGMPCAAKYTSDGRWYRAKIIDLPGNKMVEIFYVDFGNQEVLPWDHLRKLQPRFLRIAAQALHCSLSDIVPKQQQWTDNVAKYLMKITTGKVLRLYVDEVQRLQLKVTLYHSSDDVDICINGLLVRDGYATSVGVSSSLVEYHKLDGLPLALPPVSKKNLPTKVTKKKKVQSIKPISPGGEGDSFSKKSTQVESDPVNVEDPFRLEVKILSCPSPNCIYVSLVGQEEQLKNLMCELQDYYAVSSSHVGNWEVNNKCCAFSTQHEKWFRAIIVELLPDDQAKVFFKDFAEVEIVPITSLRLLDVRFSQYRDGAVKCHMASVRAAGDRSEWPTLACEYLAEQIERYPNIYITKKGEIENWSLPVELWVKNVTCGGPLEPTLEEWVTLNKRLVGQGLAIPIRGESEIESVPSEQLLKELDEHSQEVSKNNVSEWLQLSAQVEDGSKTESSDVPVDESNESSTSDLDEALVDEGDDDDYETFLAPTISDWLPPVPITKKKFKACPTFVDDDCYIYLHDADRSSDTLSIIGNALHSRFKNSEPKPHDQYWFANQLCIAQYHSDKKWYRGKVMEVNDDDRTVKVLFVDYGNIEECKASELRKNIYMTHIPIQSHKCQLYGIKPATENGKWPVNTLDFIHTTIVEKQCHVILKEEPRLGQPYAISLIGPGNIDIGELLIQMQFAIDVMQDTLDTTQSDDASVIIENEENEDEEKGNEDVIEENEDVVEALEEIKQSQTGEESNHEIKEKESEDEKEIQNNEETETPDTCLEAVTKDGLSASDENIPIQWNDLIDIEEQDNTQDLKESQPHRLTYKQLNLIDCESILVEATAILSATEVVIHPWITTDSKLASVKSEFDKVSSEIQKYARSQPLLKKPYIGEPCCACYTEDNQWYRAIILSIEERESKVKVHYVDYGNVEYLPMDKVHTLKPEWADVPVMGMRCRLWQLQRPEEWDPEKLYPRMTECLFHPPILAKIKALQPSLEVELLTEDGSSLVYQPILDEGLLIQKEELDL